MTSADRSDRIRDLFDEVVGLDPEERAAHLAEACRDDEGLRREVESLLEAADARGSGVRRALEGLQPLEEADQGEPSPGEIPAALQAALTDRYRLVRELGRGGMARVHLADDLKHPRQVAIKVMNPDLSEALGPDRFLGEIETASSLTHPHILPLHDSGEANGLLYYVMPYVEGESLRHRLDREKQLPVEDAVRIAQEIADALAYAHERGVVHRDVKPANILLEAGHAVLADFGIAKAVADMEGTQLTQPGRSPGTPAYMSPEQASGEQALDGRSDQYALGCVLYEMLAGEPPFRGARVEAVARQHLTAEPTPVTQARPSVPEGVAAALHRTLAKNPADRFRTTHELRTALAEGHRLDRPPMEPAGGPAGPARPVRKMALIGSMVVVALVGAWAAWSTFGPGGGEGRPSAAPSWWPSYMPSSVSRSTAEEGARPSILVFSFQNLSPDPDDAFFGMGLQEALTSKLDRVPSLLVKSRATADWYSDHTDPPPPPQFAREFEIDYFVQGSVRRSGDSIRIRVQLVDGPRDHQLWTREYSAPYTMEGYVRLQSEIVQQVASDLRLPISPEDVAWLNEVPTESLEAFEAFERGVFSFLEEWRRGLALPEYPSIALFERAVALDPDFAHAHAFLARALLQLPHLGPDPSRRERARVAAERSLALAPDLVYGHAALSIYYQQQGEQDKALQHTRAIVELTSLETQRLEALYLIAWRSGDRAQAMEMAREWARADPANPWPWRLLHFHYELLHRYEEALAALDREVVAWGSPDDVSIQRRMMTHLLRGERDAALALHDDLLATGATGYTSVAGSPQLATLRFLPAENRHREWEVELERASPYEPNLFRRALHERDVGSPATARILWDSLRVEAETVWPEPDTPGEHYLRALIYMELGERDEALRWARMARERYAPEQCAMDDGSLIRRNAACMMLARVLARFGQYDEALDLVEEVLPPPSWLTIHLLQLDPAWKDLWGHPRFERILVEYADQVDVAPE